MKFTARSGGILLLLLLSLSLAFSCRDSRQRIKEGRLQLSRGDFDAALESFQKAAQRTPDDPEVQQGLGMVLSLRRVSQMSALRLLRSSLARRPDENVRWELIRLYLDMRLHGRAAELLGSNWLPIKKFFQADMRLLRSGVACLEKPWNKRLADLKKYADRPRGKYFLARCLLFRKQKAEALKVFQAVPDGSLRCELLAAFTPETFKPSELDYARELDACRSRFPGNVVLHRERPLVFSEKAATQVGAPRKIYFDDYLVPPYDRPDDEWRFVNMNEDYHDRESIFVKLDRKEKTRGKPFVPIVRPVRPRPPMSSREQVPGH